VAFLVPASEVTARLTCAGGEPMPDLVTVMAVEEAHDLEQQAEEGLLEIAAFVAEEQPLTGRLRDTLTVGPLEEGAYYLAVQPAGFDRWTWALGIEDPGEAAILQVEPGEPVEVGTLAVDCGPAIRLDPLVTSDAGLPDFRSVNPRERTLWVEGVVTRPDGEKKISRSIVESYETHLIVRGLPEGEARLEIRLLHPHFLPVPELTVRVEQTLERGRTVRLAPAIADVGGSLRVSSERGAAVRLTGPAGEEIASRPVSLFEGAVELPSLIPGDYEVELCADEACEQVLTTWNAVRIKSLRTRHLP
jgi:hypothetical protein